MKLGDLLRRLRRSRRAATPAPAVRRADYRAVGIIPDALPCRAVVEASPRRYLLPESPKLPLPDCSKPETCTCRFVKFNDRRQEERRDILSFSRWYSGKERRRNPGRRSTDT